jgi:hypothetical protein
MLRIIHDSRTRAGVAGIMLAFATLSIAACGGSDKSTGPKGSQNIGGSYSLRAVGNSGLPAVIKNGPWYDPNSGHFYNNLQATVTGGWVDLTVDGPSANEGHFNAHLDLDVVADGDPTSGSVDHSGTFSISNGRIVFTDEDGSTVDATLNNGALAAQLDVFGSGETIEYDYAK